MTPTSAVTGGASGSGWPSSSGARRWSMDVVVLDLDAARAVNEAKPVAVTHGVWALGLAAPTRARVVAAAATVEERFGGVDLV